MRRGEAVAGLVPEVLRWARERAGLSKQDVASALEVKDPVIESWEEGAGAPTYSQLEKLAYQLYRRPLALFFFPSPPAEREPKQSFRTLPDADREGLMKAEGWSF